MRRFLNTCALLAATLLAVAALAPSPTRAADDNPINVLVITGDHRGHDWQAVSEMLRDILEVPDKVHVQVTTRPARDLTTENLVGYDVLLLNYRESDKASDDTKWSDGNRQALVEAVKGGKGLVVYHFASSAFPDWDEYERLIGGGWRSQGFHGPAHVYTVKKTDADHPISRGLPDQFVHATDELYQNSKMVEGNTVLATAYSDPEKPRGTGKDEPVIWVNQYGDGRVFNIALGHDVNAMSDPVFQQWLRRGVEWAATGKVMQKAAAK